jgi:prephenate dehydrogenase
VIARVAIVGTGLIGASVGLALKASGFKGQILGWDANAEELATALKLGAIDVALPNAEAVLAPGLLATSPADVYVLATPVLPILDWMQRLAPVLGEGQLVTDVGSTKVEIAQSAAKLFNQPGRARFLPGHPMAGKESGGAALAEATLFNGATWLFTPVADSSPLEAEWRALVAGFGAQLRELAPQQHDEVCAWVSHLPQMVSTALAALLQDTFSHDPEGMAAVQAIGGRALRETTRLGSSPYSMWRDVALTNTEPLAQTLHALEQRLAHIRENLRTPELRDEFATANRFKAGSGK